MSPKPWLQGWALELSGVPHSISGAMARHMDQRQHRLGHGAKWATGHMQRSVHVC